MDLTELRTEIDAVDRELIALLERRFDVSAAIADYKRAHGLAVLDPGREAVKLSAVRAQCRPETADLIAGLYGPIMAASRAFQTQRMEADYGE